MGLLLCAYQSHFIHIDQELAASVSGVGSQKIRVDNLLRLKGFNVNEPQAIREKTNMAGKSRGNMWVAETKGYKSGEFHAALTRFEDVHCNVSRLRSANKAYILDAVLYYYCVAGGWVSLSERLTMREVSMFETCNGAIYQRLNSGGGGINFLDGFIITGNIICLFQQGSPFSFTEVYLN